MSQPSHDGDVIKRPETPLSESQQNEVQQRLMDFKTQLDGIIHDHEEDRNIFITKQAESIKLLNAETESYRNSINSLKEKYFKLLDEAEQESNDLLNSNDALKMIGLQLTNIQQQIHSKTLQYNARATILKRIIEQAAKSLKFKELQQFKTRMETTLSTLQIYKEELQTAKITCEEVNKSQKQLNLEIGFVIMKEKKVQETAECILKCLKENDVDALIKLYICSPQLFVSCDLSADNYLSIAILLSENLEDTATTSKFEIIIETLEKVYLSIRTNPIPNDFIFNMNILRTRMQFFIKSPMAIKTPNSISVYRIVNKITLKCIPRSSGQIIDAPDSDDEWETLSYEPAKRTTQNSVKKIDSPDSDGWRAVEKTVDKPKMKEKTHEPETALTSSELEDGWQVANKIEEPKKSKNLTKKKVGNKEKVEVGSYEHNDELEETKVYEANGTKITIDEDACIGCGACEGACPYGVYELVDGKSTAPNVSQCAKTMGCVASCPVDAIKVE
ncbi:Uncharacterized protein QTN25_001262 [Entamoeba marina]